MIILLFEFILLGLVGGLIGLFYRNCLKGENQIFNLILTMKYEYGRDYIPEIWYS